MLRLKRQTQPILRPSAPPARPRDSWLLPILQTLLSTPQLERLRQHEHESLWESVVAEKILDESTLVHAVAAHLGVPAADTSAVSPRAMDLLPERWARRFRVLPLSVTDGIIELATANPLDVECERSVAFATGRAVRFSVASPRAIASRLDECYRGEFGSSNPGVGTVEVQHLASGMDSAPPVESPDSTALVIRLVDQLLGDGIAAHASDIHIEPEEKGLAVRHRIDGVMKQVRVLPRELAPALVSRIKILSGLDIADRLRPHDGRARIAVNGVAVDLRVSTLPAALGEKVVVRVLDGRSTVLNLDAIGFNPDEQARIEQLLDAREGLILVTGPTGSGKTTTLYAALRRIQARGLNIVTVEDPIEYRIPGIVQVQVHERAGLTFASALRSIMRQDPDVLLIGEIRDRETAEIAIQASLTGHLVLSTLHTNDAASAVARLSDIGVAGYKIAASVKGIIAQRLVRRLCPTCRGTADARRVSESCVACEGDGYRGRLAVVEVLIGSPAFEQAVASGASAEQVARVGRESGMRPLWESGMLHVARGDTSIAELGRVASMPATGYLPVAATPAAVQRRDRLGPAVNDVSEVKIEIATVDVFVIRPRPEGWLVLALQRGNDTRCPGSWETVHGRIEPGERPEDAAIREVREESGLESDRLYSITVNPFYMHRASVVTLACVFAVFVNEDAAVQLDGEHVAYAWLSPDDAAERFVWPSEKLALQQVRMLLSTGDAGAVEDVLRVR
ncbi:MAG: type secretion system protein [Gemmatimonadetes bacterium]|nr:type secretion system protein [Gemmatimonadota bacterium]